MPPSTDGDRSSARLAAKDRAIAKVLNEAVAKPDGTEFKLADFAGKVVLVDIWATWCPPCREQAPQLAKLSQKYRDQGVEVVGLSVNEKKDQAEVLDFVKQAGMTYTVGYAGDRVSAAFLSGTEDETGQPPIPQLFVFGKDGRLVEHLVGYNESHGLTFLERIVGEQLSR
ncbi:MAG: TlpA disulfide reductase family protein [Acidobacteriota bacterium]